MASNGVVQGIHIVAALFLIQNSHDVNAFVPQGRLDPLRRNGIQRTWYLGSMVEDVKDIKKSSSISGEQIGDTNAADVSMNSNDINDPVEDLLFAQATEAAEMREQVFSSPVVEDNDSIERLVASDVAQELVRSMVEESVAPFPPTNQPIQSMEMAEAVFALSQKAAKEALSSAPEEADDIPLIPTAPSSSMEEQEPQVVESVTEWATADGNTDSLPSLEDVEAVLALTETAVEKKLAESSDVLLTTPPAESVDTSTPVQEQAMQTLAPPEVEKPAILPASAVVGEPPEVVHSPGVRKILSFAIPAIGVWLCSPLLSLIDTSAVGLLSGTAQQAALSPAVAVTDYAALLVAFLYTATTNLVAAAQEQDRGVEGKPQTSKTLVSALRMSTWVGFGLGAALFVFARTLLKLIIGNDGIHPEVFTAAMKYVRIRALGMPAAAVIGSAQAACLGMQDIKSPLYVLLAAAVVNFFGDVTFVGHTHPWVGGAAGAAWATSASQYVAAAMFLRWLCDKPAKPAKVLNLTKAIMELTGPKGSKGKTRRKGFRSQVQSLTSSYKRDIKNLPLTKKLVSLKERLSSQSAPATATNEKNKGGSGFSTRGFLHGKFRARNITSVPSKDDIAKFAPYFVPVTTTVLGKVSAYIAMNHVVSSALGTLAMAAQQVVVSLFYCLTPVADSLSLTAQSFVPVIHARPQSPARAAALRKTLMNFVKAGGIFSAVMSAAVACIPFLSRFFTSDLMVVSQINAVAPILAAIFAVHGIFVAVEGVLLGQKDLNFLGTLYSACFFAVPWFILRVKQTALAGGTANLMSIWKIFLGYNIFRTVVWGARVRWLQRKTDREAAALDKKEFQLPI